MKILTVLDHYLPGYKAGGSVRSVSNIVDLLGEDYEFLILTRDRDIGEKKSYENVKARTWHRRSNALVRYLNTTESTFLGLRGILSDVEYDLLYLNSYFSRLTIKTMFLRKFGLIRKTPVVIAPRGEFSPGALAIKTHKKRMFIHFARLIGLYKDVIWHASTKAEADDILKLKSSSVTNGKSGRVIIKVAVDPLSAPSFNSTSSRSSLKKNQGSVRIIFLSRISRKKNLEYALKLLSSSSGNIQFDIYGPNEDPGYWIECRDIIDHFPPAVRARYISEVPWEDVRDVFSKYHLFLFPTLGENYGHVIPEALSSGCLILASDRTPWRGLEQRAIGWDIALENLGKFKSALDVMIDMDDVEFARRSDAAKSFIRNYVKCQTQNLKEQYDDLFNTQKTT